MKRLFIETSTFGRATMWAGLSDEEFSSLQYDVMTGAGDVIPGTGGLRKIRCASGRRGKRGGLRVIYADYPDAAVVILVAAFAKTVKSNLTPEEVNELRELKRSLDEHVRVHYGNRRHDV